MGVFETRLTDEVFTHRAEDGKQITWNISAIWRVYDRLCTKDEVEIVEVPVDPEFAEWAFTNRGAEQHRIDRLNDDVLSVPILFKHDPRDDTHLMIDGTHRYIYSARTGKEWIRAVIVHPSVLRHAEIHVPPIQDWDGYLKSKSGF